MVFEHRSFDVTAHRPAQAVMSLHWVVWAAQARVINENPAQNQVMTVSLTPAVSLEPDEISACRKAEELRRNSWTHVTVFGPLKTCHGNPGKFVTEDRKRNVSEHRDE